MDKERVLLLWTKKAGYEKVPLPVKKCHNEA